MGVGGDIREITINHPTEGIVILRTKSGETFSKVLGGDKNDVTADSKGDSIVTKMVVPWMVKCTITVDQNIRDEQTKLQRISNSSVPASLTFDERNGTKWGGLGTIMGDLELDGMTTLLPVEFAGGGVLARIS